MEAINVFCPCYYIVAAIKSYSTNEAICMRSEIPSYFREFPSGYARKLIVTNLI
jgi:hypothetical protein